MHEIHCLDSMNNNFKTVCNPSSTFENQITTFKTKKIYHFHPACRVWKVVEVSVVGVLRKYLPSMVVTSGFNL
jgi:hypothetical protein